MKTSLIFLRKICITVFLFILFIFFEKNILLKTISYTNYLCYCYNFKHFKWIIILLWMLLLGVFLTKNPNGYKATFLSVVFTYNK